MSDTDPAAAPESGNSVPSFEELAADPEIAALLDFEPVVRKVKRPDGWTPELQRELIARIVSTGTIKAALDQMGKGSASAWSLRKDRGADSFRASFDKAVDLGRKRSNGPDAGPPSLAFRDARFTRPERTRALNLEPGQVINELGERENEQSYLRRADEARDSVSDKLRRARRLFLRDISDDPAQRAAFEILTRLPVDWDKAAQCLPQDDEPWRKPNMRNPDMLLTAEAGWLGEFTHGPDKKAELLKEINEWRAEHGLEPVGWADE